MFKVGDRVKCIRTNRLERYLTEGKEYVVLSVDSKYLNVWSDKGHIGSYYPDRFELADPFTSMSDQQLADDFRQTHRRNLELSDELIKRGYAITIWRGTHYSPPFKRRFSKVGEFPDIKIEKEKKEIISL